MKPRVAKIRLLICQQCPAPCALYKDGQINHADPAASCPVAWKGQWHSLDGIAAPAAPENAPPNLLTKAANLTRAFLKWRAAGYPKRTRDQIAACLTKCRSCPHWNEKGNLGLGQCRHPRCGCTRHKPQWATEHCPLGDW